MIACLLFVTLAEGPTALAAGTITEYPLGGSGHSPFGITAGADGNMWIAERSGSIAKMSTAGALLAEYPVPGGGEPFEITAGPDGNLWFTDAIKGAIGKITTSGVITEFTSGITSGVLTQGITAGADGNLWFTERGFPAPGVGKITTSGVVTEYTVGGGGVTETGITTGADGNVWFAAGSSIDQITPSGTITSFSTGSNAPTFVVSGPDGNIWFNSWNHSVIGKMTLTGTVTTYPTPQDTNVYGMGAGPDGNVWYSVPFVDSIARVTPTGTVTIFATPTTGSGPAGLAAGPDGNVWFSEQGTNIIGKFVIVDPVKQATATTTTSTRSIVPSTGYGAPTHVSPANDVLAISAISTVGFGLLLLCLPKKLKRSPQIHQK